MTFQVTGKNGTADIFASKIDEQSIAQIQNMLDAKMSKGTKISIMPDAHFGKGALVGTTIQLPKNRADWRISPNVVGVDIACAMMTYQIKEEDINLEKVDHVMHHLIPTGKGHYQNATEEGQAFLKRFDEKAVMTLKESARYLVETSLGSLGGGNHFVDITKDKNGKLWLTVHSGSRNLGIQVASYWQKVANEQNPDGDLSYLTGDALEGYLNDMQLVYEYAHRSREIMLDTIVKTLDLHVVDSFESTHNFVDIEHGVIRKGATDARAGERLLIPLNMLDGTIMATGLGSNTWNNSAPHGAGRVLGRRAAKEQLDFNQYESEIKNAGIYSTSVREGTLDEAPEAYKKVEDIVSNIGDTVTDVQILKPIYNFKA